MKLYCTDMIIYKTRIIRIIRKGCAQPENP